MGTTAPPAKSFMDCQMIMDFSDPTTHHDRVLLVDGQKFYVNSSLLSQFSEFFNALFNSNFKEKNEETIELKDITSADFDNFLRALYPIRFKVAGDNLAGLMQLSIRFLCPTVWGQCLEFLENKDEFNKFSPVELLQWSEGSDSLELKSIIHSNTGLAELEEFLFLSMDKSPNKLKELFKEYIFKEPKRKTHHELVDLLYYSEKYDLSIVRKHLDDFFCDLNFCDPLHVQYGFLVRKICKLPELEVKVFEYMLELVNNINEDQDFPPLEPMNYGNIEQSTNLAVDYLRNMYEGMDKTQEVVGNFLQIASQYNVVQLKNDVSADVTTDFFNKNGLKYMNLAVKYNLRELKDFIANYLFRTDPELNDEDRQIILNASPEVKDFVLNIIFKR